MDTTEYIRLKEIVIQTFKGGAGSGNFGHSGRPGEVGGSSSEGETPESTLRVVDSIDDNDRPDPTKILEGGTDTLENQAFYENKGVPKEIARNLSTMFMNRHVAVYKLNTISGSSRFSWDRLPNEIKDNFIKDANKPKTITKYGKEYFVSEKR